MLRDQMERLQEEIRLTELLARLGIILMGGSVAVAAMVSGEVALDGMGLVLVLIAVLLNLSAVAWASIVVLGGGLTRLAVGPSLDALAAESHDRGWTADRLNLSLLRLYPRHWRRNSAVLALVARQRRNALAILIAAVVFYLALSVYIGGGRFFG